MILSIASRVMKGGALPFLPLPDSVTNGQDLKTMMDFIYVSCHGAQDNHVFLVPENTFILFRGPSGVSVPLAKTEDELLNKVKYLPDRKGANESTPALIETKKDAWFQTMYDDIRTRNFLKEILFDPKNPEAPRTTAIYTPGDVIQNLILQFENNSPLFFLTGIYELPMRRCVRDDIGALNHLYFEKEEEKAGPLITKYFPAGYKKANGSEYSNDEKLTLLKDKKKGLPISESDRDAFYQEFAGIMIPIMNACKKEQDNISNCRERGNSKLHELGIGDTPCNPIAGLQNSCIPAGAAAAVGRGSAHGALAAAALLPAVNVPEPRQISLHELVTRRIHRGTFGKPFKFVLVEACRALPMTYGQELEYLKYRIRPEGIGFNEAAELERIVRSGATHNVGQALYRSRRYSLNARELNIGRHDACFTTLLRLSKQRLQFLPNSVVKDKLLDGKLVTYDEFDGAVRSFREVDAVIRTLPRKQQFTPGQFVKITTPGAANRIGMIETAEGSGSKPLKYVTRVINTNANSVKTNYFEPKVLSGINQPAGLSPAIQEQLARPLSFPSTYFAIAPTTVHKFIIIDAYGKTFEVDSKFKPRKKEIETIISRIPFSRIGDEVYLGFNPEFPPEKQTKVIGTKWETIELIIDDSGPSLIPEIRISRDHPSKPGEKQLTTVPPSILARTRAIALDSIPKAGGARKTRKAKGRGQSRKVLRGKFCRCIKKVRKTVKARKANKEKAAIGICVKSVLGTRKRTLYKFSCKKGKLETQDPFRK